MISCTVRLVAVGSLVSVLSTAVFAQDVRPYRPGIDVLDYLISIQLPDTGSVIRGDAMLTVRRTARLDSLVLDLRALEVRQVLIDKRTVRFGRNDSTLAIPLPPGDTGHFRIRVLYGGAVTDGLIAGKDSAGRWTYFGDNWPNRARFWIPSVDHPSDKATVTWRVTAPTSKTVIANGSFLGISRGKRSTTTWRESRPIPTYLMVIAAAPLTRYELGETACGLAELRRCVAQAVYAAPEQRGILPGSFARAGEIVRYFASQVGPFP
jgi:aminopeptidase N